jgi:hypothetical protein
MVKISIYLFIYFLFGLLELEMADLRCFFGKNDLCPLGVKFPN